jgi:hypothetical protein
MLANGSSSWSQASHKDSSAKRLLCAHCPPLLDLEPPSHERLRSPACSVPTMSCSIAGIVRDEAGVFKYFSSSQLLDPEQIHYIVLRKHDDHVRDPTLERHAGQGGRERQQRRGPRRGADGGALAGRRIRGACACTASRATRCGTRPSAQSARGTARWHGSAAWRCCNAAPLRHQ